MTKITRDGLIYTTIDSNNVILGDTGESSHCGIALAISSTGFSILDTGSQFTEKDTTYTITEILSNSFCQTYDLETVKIPYSVTHIGDAAFRFCSKLNSLIFEEKSKLQVIRYNAFDSCSSLKRIILPPSLQTIGETAFGNFTQLSQIIYCGTSTFRTQNILYPKSGISDSDLKIFVVHGLYQSNYFGKYRAISTSECIIDSTIKAKFLTCRTKNKQLQYLLIFTLIFK